MARSPKLPSGSNVSWGWHPLARTRPEAPASAVFSVKSSSASHELTAFSSARWIYWNSVEIMLYWVIYLWHFHFNTGLLSYSVLHFLVRTDPSGNVKLVGEKHREEKRGETGRWGETEFPSSSTYRQEGRKRWFRKKRPEGSSQSMFLTITYI